MQLEFFNRVPLGHLLRLLLMTLSFEPS